MKKLLSILILYSSLAFSQTSVYHPFPDSNAQWNVELDYYVYCTPFTYNSITTYSYVFGADTVIGSYTYHQLYVPAYQSYYSGAPCYNDTVAAGSYIGSIRQDTAARKVYYVFPVDTAEQLLYDFNLSVGDTIRGYLARDCNSGSMDQTVVSIDSILIGSDYRTRWNFGLSSAYSIIEGIGSTKGLLEPVCELIDGPIYALDCFKQNDTVYYPSLSTTCDLETSTVNFVLTDNSFSIFPNPAQDYFTITGYGLLEIYSLQGSRVYSENLRSHIKTIRCNLQPGIYFARLTAGQKSSVKKLIIE
jgi:hypothetical protein